MDYESPGASDKERVCSHPDGWSERGMGDDRWQECWLCREQRDKPEGAG